MATANHTKESTMQKAPTIISNIDGVDFMHTYPWNQKVVRVHGYCTVHQTSSLPLFDVFCQIDGDEVRVGRDLTAEFACDAVNLSNTVIHNGEEVAA